MGGFIYGLAVALLLSEGIIIQCEGTGGARGIWGARGVWGAEGPTSSNQVENVPTSDSKGRFMPKDLFKKIFYEIDNDGRVAIRNNLSNKPEDVMYVLLENCIIFIQTEFFDVIDSELEPGELFASYKDKNSDVKLIFVNYGKLVSFLENYGKHVKKIHIEMSAVEELLYIPRNIKEYATNLEELQALCIDNKKVYWKFWQFWHKISKISFPKVKTFRMVGSIKPTDFDLNSIFPELKYLSLDGDVGEECLDNVKNLKELTLKTTSIPEEKFGSIFQKNNGITMIHILAPKMRKTMQLIAQHLEYLKTLEVNLPGKEFLLQSENDPKCLLGNVKKFAIIFNVPHEVYEIEKLSFEMPNLQELNLHGKFDGRFLQFIKHFGRLEILRLPSYRSELLQRVEETWTYSKETRIDYYNYIEFKKPGKQ